MFKEEIKAAHIEMQFILLEQKYLETLNSGNSLEALKVLRAAVRAQPPQSQPGEDPRARRLPHAGPAPAPPPMVTPPSGPG